MRDTVKFRRTIMALYITTFCKNYDIVAERLKTATTSDEARAARAEISLTRKLICDAVGDAMRDVDGVPSSYGVGEYRSTEVPWKVLIATRTLSYFSAWLALRGGWSTDDPGAEVDSDD